MKTNKQPFLFSQVEYRKANDLDVEICVTLHQFDGQRYKELSAEQSREIFNILATPSQVDSESVLRDQFSLMHDELARRS